MLLLQFLFGCYPNRLYNINKKPKLSLNFSHFSSVFLTTQDFGRLSFLQRKKDLLKHQKENQKSRTKCSFTSCKKETAAEQFIMRFPVCIFFMPCSLTANTSFDILAFACSAKATFSFAWVRLVVVYTNTRTQTLSLHYGSKLCTLRCNNSPCSYFITQSCILC